MAKEEDESTIRRICLPFQLSRYKYFNTTYPTLLINLDGAAELLAKVAPRIGYSSNLYMANASSGDSDGEEVKLFEIFSFGLHLHNSTMQLREVNKWTSIENYIPNYGRDPRRNFNGIQLRGVTVVSK